MEISGIVTKRNWQNDFFWQIVYEWEDILLESLNSNFFYEPSYFKCRYSKVIPYIYDLLLFKKGYYFYYDMNAGNIHTSRNSPHLIPCVIDFWKNDSDIDDFERKYCRHKLVLITSREVYEYLKNNNCKIPIAHLPLSISNKYRITPQTHFDKKYDVVLMGRQNPILKGWLDHYCSKHPELVYVYSARKGSESYYHYSSTGEEIGNIDTREKYINLMRQGRVALYSTPGTDGQKDAGGFSQVTPRFLELIACGCHVLSRYIKNADTDWFKLEDISPNIDSYEQFEHSMNYALANPVDMEKYSKYLENYYTTTVAIMLQKLLDEF